MKSLIVQIALAFFFAGCEGVPDLTFVDANAGDGAAEVGSDAGADANPNADAGTMIDAAPPICPVAPPPPATTCCGTNNEYPCAGECGTTQCALCASSCGTGKLCCGRMGGMVTCFPLESGHCQ